MKRVNVILAAACAAMAFDALAAWTYDATNKVLTDGTWAFSNTVYDADSKKVAFGLEVRGAIVRLGESDETTIDFSDCKEDLACGLGVTSLYTAFGSDVPCKRLVAPDLRTIIYNSGTGAYAFSGNTTIEEVEFGPDLASVGAYAFRNTTSLRTMKPSRFAALTTIGERALEGTALEGDFEFPAVTFLGACAFYNATNITSLTFDTLTKTDKNWIFAGMNSLTNIAFPQATSLSTSQFVHDGSNLRVPKLRTLTLSSDLTSMPYLSYCSSLERITPTSFPKLTSQVNFVGCTKLTGDFSLPLVTQLPQSAFEGTAITSLDAPELGQIPVYGFLSCKSLTNLVMKGASTSFGGGKVCLTRLPADFILDWCSTNVPTGFGHNCIMEDGVKVDRMSIHPENTLSPPIFKVRLTDDNRAALEAICTATAANFTDAHRHISNYDKVAKKVIGFVGNPKLSGTIVTSISVVEPKGCFWLVDGTEVPTVAVTFECPPFVEVSRVTADGFDVAPNADGTYTVEEAATMSVTYAPTAGRLFTDGTSSLTVSGLTPTATVAASTCTKTTVAALARIGESLYLTLEDAVAVGGTVAPTVDQTLAAPLAVAADRELTIDLDGKTLTASGAAFDVAGTLAITGTGFIESATPFAGSGTVLLGGGTYRVDVSSRCAPGYVATALGTDPEGWVVAPNTNVATLSLDTATFASEHLSAVEFRCAAPAVCETNGTVVSWTIAKELPFELAYTAEGSYRFADRSRTASVAYADGIGADATVGLESVPVRIGHPTWSWDRANGTCTDGNWTFNCSKVTSLDLVNDVYGIQLTKRTAGSGDLDLLTFREDVGGDYDVISFGKQLFYNNASVTNVCAPGVTKLYSSAFQSAKGLGEVELSSELFYVADNVFYGSGMTGFRPTVCPELTYLSEGAFNGTGIDNFVAPKMTSIPYRCFGNCKSLTNMVLAAVTGLGTESFNGCLALVSAEMPKATSIGGSSFKNCTALKSVVFDAENTTGIYKQAFYSANSITNFPNRFPKLKVLDGNSLPTSIAGDVYMPLVTSLRGGQTFAGCAGVTSVCLPSCTNYSNYAFSRCSSLTNVTVLGSAHAYDSAWGESPFSDDKLLEEINWLGTEVPEKLMGWGLSQWGKGWTKGNVIPVVRVTPAKTDAEWAVQKAAWEALCTVKASELTDAHRLIPNRPTRHVIGFIGGTVTVKNDEVTAIAADTGNVCWVVHEPLRRPLSIVIR